MESKESKYIMAIIKIPVEIQSNGKTVTHLFLLMILPFKKEKPI
jgi:hypothetical protein